MTKIQFLSICASAVFLWSANPSKADPLEACIAAHDQCIATCRDDPTAAGRTTCVVTCATEEARCAAQTGLAEATPFLERKLEELEGLMEKFLDDFMPKPAPRDPAPSQPTET